MFIWARRKFYKYYFHIYVQMFIYMCSVLQLRAVHEQLAALSSGPIAKPKRKREKKKDKKKKKKPEKRRGGRGLTTDDREKPGRLSKSKSGRVSLSCPQSKKSGRKCVLSHLIGIRLMYNRYFLVPLWKFTFS